MDGRREVPELEVRELLTWSASSSFGRQSSPNNSIGCCARTFSVPQRISPAGQKKQHPTVVDETVELWDTVYVSGGRRGLDVEIAPADLVGVTGAIVADVARA